MQILHVIITHLPPELAARHVALAEAYTPGVPRLIAYGGPAAAFGELPWTDKFLLKDPSLSGPVIHQCFNELLPGICDWMRRQPMPFDAVHVTEYDHWILRADYFAQLAEALARSGADFLGKNCGIKTHTNWMHLFRYRDDPALLGYLARFSVHEEKSAICGMLGNGFTISRRALEAFAALPEPPRVYNEVLVPTLIHHLGFQIADIGAYSDAFRHVRWGPLWTEEELVDLARRGAACCHPFKDIPAACRLLAPLARGR
ncbi:MAG: hypothetical protein PHQ12_05215 [Chthoniobacteraceae bacterium]|nr:hypothetical protein [Chthoniobacteraceae bacterium]